MRPPAIYRANAVRSARQFFSPLFQTTTGLVLRASFTSVHVIPLAGTSRLTFSVLEISVSMILASFVHIITCIYSSCHYTRVNVYRRVQTDPLRKAELLEKNVCMSTTRQVSILPLYKTFETVLFCVTLASNMG